VRVWSFLPAVNMNIVCAVTDHLYGVRRSAVVDNIVSEYQKEITGSHIYDYGNSEGAKIYKMLETAAEPEFLMADMTPEQLSSFAAYKAKLNVSYISELVKVYMQEDTYGFTSIFRQIDSHKWKVQLRKL